MAANLAVVAVAYADGPCRGSSGGTGGGSGWRRAQGEVPGRGQGREVGERGEGGDEARHLTRSPPEIVRAQTGGVCRATQQVLHRVLRRLTLGAQWGRQPANPEEVVSHCREEARPKLCEGGSGWAWE